MKASSSTSATIVTKMGRSCMLLFRGRKKFEETHANLLSSPLAASPLYMLPTWYQSTFLTSNLNLHSLCEAGKVCLFKLKREQGGDAKIGQQWKKFGPLLGGRLNLPLDRLL